MSVAPVRSAVSSMLGEPHHDGSELHVLERPESLGGDATVRLRTSRGAADRVLLRYSRDGEPRTVEAIVDEESDHETWWRATFPVANPATRYRWLIAGGDSGYGWLTGNGVASHEVPSSDDFIMSLGNGPEWHLSAVVYEIFPDRFASSGVERNPPDWAVPRAWGELPTGRGPATPREWYGGDLRRNRGAPGPHRVARRERRLPDADLPGGLDAPIRREQLRARRPAARRRRGARLARARGRGARDQARRRPDVESHRSRT